MLSFSSPWRWMLMEMEVSSSEGCVGGGFVLGRVLTRMGGWWFERKVGSVMRTCFSLPFTSPSP